MRRRQENRRSNMEATEMREKVAEKMQEIVKICNENVHRDGGLTAHDKVVRMMNILRESAEEAVGREFKQKLVPFMDGHLEEMKEKTEEINALFRAVLTAKTVGEEPGQEIEKFSHCGMEEEETKMESLLDQERSRL